VVESAPSGNPEIHKRRSSRIVQAVPLTVSGVDALGRPFQERTSSLIINCHGCRYQSKHYVLKNMWVTLEVPNPEPGSGPRTARARVMWIQRPRTVRELFQVGVELETPGNLWGIAFPPSDWFPLPDAARVDASPLAAEQDRELPHPSQPQPSQSHSSQEVRHEWIAPPSPEPEPVPEEIHTPVSVEDNLRTMPVGDVAEPSLALARQMTRLVHEAKEQLHAALRESAAETVSSEMRPLMASLQQQLQEAAERSAEAAAEQALRRGMAQAAQANEAQLEALREQWHREMGESIEQAGNRVSDRLAEIAHERAAAFENQMETRYHLALEKGERATGDFSSRLARAQEQLEHLDKQSGDSAAATVQEIEQRIRERVEQAQDHLQQLDKQTAESAAAMIQEIEQRVRERVEQARAQLSELDQTARQLEGMLSSTAAAAHSGWQERLDADLAVAAGRWNEQIETSIESAAQQTAERIARNSQQTTQQLERDLSARISAIEAAFAQAHDAAEADLQSLRASLANEYARAQDSVHEIQSASQQAGEWPSKISEMTQTAQRELERRAAALVEAESQQLALRAQENLAAWTQRLEAPLEAVARQTVARLGAEFEDQIASRIERARAAFEELERGALSAQTNLHAHQEALAHMSEREIENALGRLQDSMLRLEQNFGESGRAATTKWLAELDSKAVDTTHAAFESLFKTAEWYEKKVHTQMQAAMEKGIEQASGALREKAGELSGLFATELDHYSRNYVEHTQGQVEEAAREALARIGKESAEIAATTAASLAQQAQNQTEAAMGDLRDRSAVALDQLAVEMGVHAAQVQKALETESQSLSEEFRASLAKHAQQTMGESKEELFSEVALAKDSVRNTGEELEKQLRQTIVSLSDNAMSDYKKRLESASDSWLLATMAKLNQQSAQRLEEITQSTQERLRETCNQVFTGVGETLRRRMADLFETSAVTTPPESK
jgi:hypothetical protein